MGQVPGRYGLIGGGQLATHLAHYFQLRNIPLVSWSRKNPPSSRSGDLRDSDIPEKFSAKFIEDVDILLLAISDGAIEPFIRNMTAENKELNEKKWIHFSGALTTPLAQSFHPLMTFGKEFYDLKTYEEIVFVTEPGPLKFKDIFPELLNRHYVLSSKDRGLYHALCVMSGNFTVLLWEKFFNCLEKRFKIPRAAAYPYLRQICANLLEEKSGSVLTGPLVRGDQKTIESNLASLEGDSFHGIYKAFVNAYNSDALTASNRRDHEQHP